MNVRKILVPVDFSPYGKAAIETATAMARESNAKILFVHVQGPPASLAGNEIYYIGDPENQDTKTELLAVRPTDDTVPFDHLLLVGSAAAGILRVAEDEQVDMIVMPTHGRTGLSRVLMGSVAEEVVRKARCPVLTIKANP